VSDTVLIPGGRDVRATLDTAASDGSRADAVVVACPPHPNSAATGATSAWPPSASPLADRGIDCLRFDYGDWDEGYGEH